MSKPKATRPAPSPAARWWPVLCCTGLLLALVTIGACDKASSDSTDAQITSNDTPTIIDGSGTDVPCIPNDHECGEDGCGGDHGDCAQGSCVNGYCSNPNAPKTFYASFEGGTTTADVGSESIDNRYGGDMSVVANPQPTAANPSNYVLKITIPSGSSVRAEYHSQRLPTVDKGYIYTWKEHFPTGLLSGADVSWLVFSQWKTWPCSLGNGYEDAICYPGGIFNDVELNGSDLEFRFRAEPDCFEIQEPIPDGGWTSYVLEIFYTQTSNGYYRLYQDGVLLVEQSGVRTLFDGFVDDGSCDLYWGVGLYSSWTEISQSNLVVHIDDMTIYDLDDGVSLIDVCPACGL